MSEDHAPTRAVLFDVDGTLVDSNYLHVQAWAEALVAVGRPAPARELLRAVHARGILVVLATSAPEDELAKLRAALDCEDAISFVTSSTDVKNAKPSPEVIEVALEKADVSASHAVLVGDAVWDAEASGRADVPFVGVLSGGIGRSELRAAGAHAVYEDPCDLLRGLDESPLTQIGTA